MVPNILASFHHQPILIVKHCVANPTIFIIIVYRANQVVVTRLTLYGGNLLTHKQKTENIFEDRYFSTKIIYVEEPVLHLGCPFLYYLVSGEYISVIN